MMRLFHVSEESDIVLFEPRLPTRKDLDPNVGLVWALCERTLPNFLTPREAPRVCYHAHASTPPELLQDLFSYPDRPHVVAIESGWFEKMRKTKLYLYEFDSSHFQLQDESAGYYVSRRTQIPIGKWEIDDCYAALMKRNVELRVLPNLWPLCKRIQREGNLLHWSMCRMKNALPAPE